GTSTTAVVPMAAAHGPGFWMIDCDCGAWRRATERPGAGSDLECDSCGRQLQPARASLCVEPRGFRTNFWVRESREPADARSKHRSIFAEGVPLSLRICGSSNLSIDFKKARTYRLNRGAPAQEPSGRISYRGFIFQPGRDNRRV